MGILKTIARCELCIMIIQVPGHSVHTQSLFLEPAVPSIAQLNRSRKDSGTTDCLQRADQHKKFNEQKNCFQVDSIRIMQKQTNNV